MRKTNRTRLFFEIYCFLVMGFVSVFLLIHSIKIYDPSNKGSMILLGISLFFTGVTILAYFFARKLRKEGKTLGMSYKFELSLTEWCILLFKRKECPYCNSKVRRVIKKSFIEEGYDGDFGTYGNKYIIKIYYECDICRKKIKLLELGNSPK